VLPKSYNITFNVNGPAYGTTSSASATNSISVPYNENLSEHAIKMPTNTYYKSTYQYEGVEYYGFDGKSNKVAGFGKDVEFTAYWGIDKAVNDTTHHTAGYENIYYIKNQSDLSQVGNHPEAYFLLIDDVHIDGAWNPISSFSGTLNGNEKTIHTMQINRSAYSGSSHLHLGLFAELYGRVTNLNMKDASIYVDSGHNGEGWIFAGTIAGYVGYNSIIELVNVYNSNVIVHREKSEFGGISGTCDGTIQNCGVFGVTVYGNGDQGGITGGLKGTVKNSHANASGATKTYIKHYGVNTGRCVGGIVGYSNGGTISECSVDNIYFALEGGYSLEPPMGYIVGHQQGGTIYLVGLGSTHSYSPDRNSSDMYNKGFIGIGAYDYRDYYFNEGQSPWGCAGKVSDNPSIT
jgi:hypothetical protein